MRALSEQQIRTSLVNTSRREASQAILPDLTQLDWTMLDYLGWHDPRRPLESYVVLHIEGSPVGIQLRPTPRAAARRKAVCAWCHDILATADVSMYVARRAGALGRRGDTVGTLICTDFNCSRNVRRTPSIEEVGSEAQQDRARLIEHRMTKLRERSARFIANLVDRDSAGD